MIIWKGLGIVGILLPFIIGLLTDWIFTSEYFPSFGYIIGAIPVWFLGKSANNQTEKYRDPLLENFGHWLDAPHSAFFIKMEYWAIIYTLIGLNFFVPLQYQEQTFFSLFKVVVLYGGGIGMYYYWQKAQLDKKKKKEAKSEKIEIDNENKQMNETSKKEPKKNFEDSDHSRFKPKSDSTGTKTIE